MYSAYDFDSEREQFFVTLALSDIILFPVQLLLIICSQFGYVASLSTGDKFICQWELPSVRWIPAASAAAALQPIEILETLRSWLFAWILPEFARIFFTKRNFQYSG